MENVVVETTVKSHYKTNREKNTNKTKRILYKSFRRGKIEINKLKISKKEKMFALVGKFGK